MLAIDGIEAIWKIHGAAAIAHRSGHTSAAEFMIEIADAAEELWRKRVVNELGSPYWRSSAPDE
jgi:hypothetical protein